MEGFVQDDDPSSLTRRTRRRAVNLSLEFSGVVHSDGRRFAQRQRVMGTASRPGDSVLVVCASARKPSTPTARRPSRT
ncbi:hypothetical protein [Streptomyces sp. AS02]|uniref:hypothetical protein n=1 Tax=Streptomyces sp. AS02 TaxID=2938946 RepID=UPI0020227456|nr:hypothetical protein [Streptomyces sp. AS02]MCL8016258.1 hypothetical protein [Streptomyces sp. AS02]